MQLAPVAFLATLLAATATANPLLSKRGPVPVGFGQEIQNPDQTNHWVRDLLSLPSHTGEEEGTN